MYFIEIVHPWLANALIGLLMKTCEVVLPG